MHHVITKPIYDEQSEFEDELLMESVKLRNAAFDMELQVPFDYLL